MIHHIYGGPARYNTRWAYASYCPHARALYYGTYVHAVGARYGLQKTASRTPGSTMGSPVGTLSKMYAYSRLSSRSVAYRVTYDCTECHTGEAGE